MYSDIGEPKQRLVKEIIPAMRWNAAIGSVIEILVFAIIFGFSLYFSWSNWVNWIILIGAILALISAIWLIGLRPAYIYKNTRYDLNEDFLQLKTGAFFEEHELVPMTKIQSVTTHQGPILRKFNLYSVEVETMGTSHTIKGLTKDLAFDLRNQIARFAKIREVDE